MKVRILVATVSGLSIGFSSQYAGMGIEGGYYVLELDEPGNLDLGDVLSGDFDWSGYPPFSVRNTNQGQRVRILVHLDDCPLDSALAEFLKLLSSRPVSIFVGCTRLASDSPDVDGQLRSEILKPRRARTNVSKETPAELKFNCCCGQRIAVNATASGQEFACPSCGAMLVDPENR